MAQAVVVWAEINLLISHFRTGDVCVWCCVCCVVPRCVIVATMSRKKITDEELVAMVLEHYDSDDDVDSLYGFSSVESSSYSSFESEYRNAHTRGKPQYITHSALPASRFHQPRCFITSYTAAAPCILQFYLQNYLYLDNRSSYSIKQCMHGFLKTCSVNVAQQKYKICT